MRSVSSATVAGVGAARPARSEKMDANHQPAISASRTPSVRKTGAVQRLRASARGGCTASPARNSAGHAEPGRCAETSPNECSAKKTPQTIAAERSERSEPSESGRHFRSHSAIPIPISATAGQPISTASHSQSLSG